MRPRAIVTTALVAAAVVTATSAGVEVGPVRAVGEAQPTAAPKPPVAELVPAEKLRKAVRARDHYREQARTLSRRIVFSPDAELALQVAGIAYGQSWTHMRACWLSEGYRNAERFQARITRSNNEGSGATGPAQFMPGTFAGTPYGHLDIHNVLVQAMATGWMWSRGRRGEWAGAGC